MIEIIPPEEKGLLRLLVDAPAETVVSMEVHGESHGPTTLGRDIG